MSSLSIRGLEKDYGSVSVLKDIDISIDSGDFLVLVGPSGCGKSTLLNIIAGLESITSGEIHIADLVVNALPPAERDIAMVFQSYALYPNMNVAQNMAFGMEMRGVDKETRNKEVKKVAEILQIQHLLNRKPAQLSGGQRQRVAMGRALVRDPKIFLFDEPLSNLDAKLRVEMRSEIKRLHQRMKSTIVYVTHDQVEALSMATKIVILHAGIVQQQGTPAEIYNNPANTFVASFMGSPPMNLIPAKVTGTVKKPQAEVTLPDNSTIAIPVDIQQPPAKGSDIILGIRPEHVNDKETKKQTSGVTFETKLDMVELTGADTYGVITLSGKELIFRLLPDGKQKTGDKSRITVDIDKLYWFDAETGQRL